MSSAGDQRRFPRYEYIRPAEIRFLPTYPAIKRSDKPVAVQTRDLSRGGVGFCCNLPLYPGERLVMATNDGSEFRVEVKWCRCVGDDHYEIGTELTTSAEEC